ncbi:MAG TPA: pilus assembly protein TadG-related protein [Candidatus Binataceae bacterium]|nr:pilus assembly protein TadG-related protein [Candidatus Binataceae bacterium]
MPQLSFSRGHGSARELPRIPRRQPESGQAVVVVTLVVVALLTFAGLAVDVGFFMNQRRTAQTAADSAAVAAARELQANDNAEVVAAADLDASKNGFTNGTNGVTVTVNQGAAITDPNFASKTGVVQVIVERNVPTYFLRVIGLTTVPVRASAISGQSNGPACVYAMDPTASGSFQVNGSVNYNSDCGVIVNSSSGTALIVNGAGTVNTSGIGIVGAMKQSSATFNPTPVTGISHVADPLAYLQFPSVGSCTYTNYSYKSGGTVTLNPGTYCGGITVKKSSNVILNPGNYIIDGGGITVDGTSTLNGNGVTLFLTGGPGEPYGGVTIDGSSSESLTAPTTGPYAGILFFQDRAITGTTAANNGNTFNGSSTQVYQGALYFPTTALTYNGAASAQYTILVADSIGINGSATIGANYTSLPGGSPIKDAVVSE